MVGMYRDSRLDEPDCAARERPQQLCVHSHELYVELIRECSELAVVRRAIALRNKRKNRFRTHLELKPFEQPCGLLLHGAGLFEAHNLAPYVPCQDIAEFASP